MSVACDTPGGFGRAAPGSTTSYTGVDLLTGGEPTVTPDKMRPDAQRRNDLLPPQPVATIVLLLVVAGAVTTVAASDARVRRASAVAFGGGAAVLLVVNQALVESALVAMVAEQITQPLPAGKAVRDYVHTGSGFGLCLILLAATVVANAIGLLRLRSRRAMVDPTAAAINSVHEPPTIHTA